MKKLMALLVLLVFVWGCATSVPIAGYKTGSSIELPPTPPSAPITKIILTENNIGLLEGQWLGRVKVTTIQSGILEYNASLNIKVGEKKAVLIVGGPNTFENCALKEGCLFGEKKRTREWIRVASLGDGRIKVEFETENKNPALANVKGEGFFVRY